MKQSIINEIKDKAVPSAKTYPCTEILREAGFRIAYRGNQAYANCYICGKRGRSEEVEMDKFSVNTDRNMYHCFGCGEAKGGPAKLFSDLYNISFIEASLILALRNGDITMDEYNKATKSHDALKKLTSDSHVYEKFDLKDAEDVEHKAPVEIVDLVYRHLLALPEFKLSDEHYKYLINVRKMSDAEIKECGFFSYLTPFSIDNLLKRIQSEAPSFNYDMFYGVPGFYFEYTNKEKTKGKWMFKKPFYAYLGIPLRNSYGMISALQLRYMGKKKIDNKYIYVTSKKKEIGGKDVGFGSSPGAPIHVCYPSKLLNSTIYIGEGFFKMREIAKEGSMAFSCQGVNTIKHLAEEIKLCIKSPKLCELARPLKDKIMKFVIVFDADMYEKVQVVEAGVKMADYLSKTFPNREIYFLCWDPALGKGYDDAKFYCLENGIDYRKKVRALDSNLFISLVKESIRIADRQYLLSDEHKHDGLKDTDIKIRRTTGWKRIFYEKLYKENVSRYL